jgi:hypothetical protein
MLGQTDFGGEGPAAGHKAPPHVLQPFSSGGGG